MLAYIHTNKEEVIQNSASKIKDAYEISEERPEEYKEILDII